jgi:hypothetical protein
MNDGDDTVHRFRHDRGEVRDRRTTGGKLLEDGLRELFIVHSRESISDKGVPSRQPSEPVATFTVVADQAIDLAYSEVPRPSTKSGIEIIARSITRGMLHHRAGRSAI